MAPALTLIIPTTKAPPAAWSTAEALITQATALNAEIVIATGHAIAMPAPSDPCRVLHIPGADVFELRAAALAVADGDIIMILEDHNFPAGDFCTRVLTAFDENPSADGVVGTATNGSPDLLDRATFLLTFGPFLAPMAEVPPDRNPPPGIVAFRRSVVPTALPRAGWLEYQMVAELREAGFWVADDRVQVNHIQHVGFRAFAIHFHSGRAYGGISHEPRSSLSRWRRLRAAAATPALLMRQTRAGLRRGNTRESIACHAAVGAFAACNAFGQMVGVLFGAGKSPSHLE